MTGKKSHLPQIEFYTTNKQIQKMFFFSRNGVTLQWNVLAKQVYITLRELKNCKQSCSPLCITNKIPNNLYEYRYFEEVQLSRYFWFLKIFAE